MKSTTYTVGGKAFELKHHGVKGMKWGVRRYQNKDGTLTKAGLKRRKALDDAAETAKRMVGYAKRDAKYFAKKADQAEKRTITDAMVKKHLRSQFGNDIDTKEGREYLKDVLGTDDLDKWARDDLSYDATHYRKQIEKCRRLGEHYLKMNDMFANAKVSDLSKSDIKKAEKFVRKAAWSTVGDVDWEIKYDNERYGLQRKT